jgi:hypothetical protein
MLMKRNGVEGLLKASQSPEVGVKQPRKSLGLDTR